MGSRTCKRPGCPVVSRKLGMCNRHYNIQRRIEHQEALAANQRAEQIARLLGRCDHLDCHYRARYRFTLPYPITRQERACRVHAEHLLGSFLPGTTVEDI